MAYISGDKMAHLGPHVETLINALRELESDDPNNSMEDNIGFVLAKILDRVYEGNSSSEMHSAMGVLLLSALDFYRCHN